MAISALVVTEGAAAANAANASGFTISIPQFSVSSIVAPVSATKTYATRDAVWFTAPITSITTVSATTVKYSCVVPAGAALGITAINQIYLQDTIGAVLYVQGTPTASINYDPAGSVTIEIDVTITSIPSSSYSLYNTAAIDLVTHESNATFHPKTNYGAITAPLVTSDAAAGYSEGSTWVNTVTNRAYVLVDRTNAAAVWKELSPTTTGILNNYTGTVAPTVGSDSGLGYSVGSVWVDTVANNSYTAVDVTLGAAIWVKSTSDVKVLAVAPIAPVVGEQYLNTTDGFFYIWNGTAWVDITAAGSGIKNNYAAIVDPTPTADVNAGYSVGSLWINVVSGTTYIAVDDTAGAAKWSRFGGAQEWTAVTNLFTSKGNDAVFVDTTALPATVTLPLVPLIGTKVTVVDHKGTFATNACTIAGNGKNIMGLAASMVLSTNNRFVTLVYDGVSDWRIAG